MLSNLSIMVVNLTDLSLEILKNLLFLKPQKISILDNSEIS